MMAVRQERWIAMRVLLEGRIDNRDRRDVFRPPRSSTRSPHSACMRMVSRGPHVAPRKSLMVLLMTSTVPPAAGTLFSVPSAKKPIQRLSGDQNGSWASSVPASCARVHMILRSKPEHGSGARRSRH